MDVQEAFYTLSAGEGADIYAKAKDALSKYFSPLSKVPFERYKFRTTSQKEGETIEQFIGQLKKTAGICAFGDIDAVDIQIRDQIVEK